ncbi:hypothetical protein F7725_008481 [Dissostichus mawsoni]|uniref:Vesicle transport v-SNARE N-terminal domain-containing protein n=1 Tax=Dissostichus mawsoni TaxID=36200 RepID=A0A7J5YAF6_DISMA|nr:hypothetical protein F7725_008481 [Dissostichus mawsoni]
MSSEEFEKLHEIYKSLFEELKLLPEKALRSQGVTGMDEELRSAPSAFRNMMSTKLRMYSRDLGKLQRDMKTSDSGSSSQAGVGNPGPVAESVLLQGTDSLTNASQSIERTLRIAAETDQVGTDIIEELGGQREQLDRARNKADDQQAAVRRHHHNGVGYSSSCGLSEVLPMMSKLYNPEQTLYI